MTESSNESAEPARIVAPSLLAADYASLATEAADAGACGGDWLHLDIMDGHFVNNLSFGPGIVKAVRPHSELFFDVHLMISRPDRYWEAFADAGADGITVHVEADHDVGATLRAIRAAGLKTGLALNPATAWEAAKPHLEVVDLILCMTVVPGFGGQSFMREVLPKISAARDDRRAHQLHYHIEVDGGIDAATAVEAAGAGANVLVAGTTIFGAEDRGAAVESLRLA